MNKSLLMLVLSLILLPTLTYSQYPKTKIINNDTVVILSKSQADDINAKFLYYTKTLDSQARLINYYKDTPARLRDCYNVNRGLTEYFVQTNNLQLYFDTCTRKQLKKRYKELKKIRENKYK